MNPAGDDVKPHRKRWIVAVASGRVNPRTDRRQRRKASA